MYSVFNSIFYILSYIALFVSVVLVEKSHKKLNIVVYLPIFIMFMMLYNTFYAGIIDILTIPINLITLGIGNLLGAMGISLYCIKTKKVQQYSFKLLDFVLVVLLTVVVAYVSISQFGFNLIPNYETTDPTRHLRMAQQTIECGRLGNMYFASLNNATIISVGLGFFKSFWSYKFFVLSDIVMFWLSATLLYSVAHLYAKKPIQKIITLFVVTFYVLGYPLNNMVFGFVYLGMCVSICAFLIFISNLYFNDAIEERIAIAAMMFGCCGVINGYSLFAPFVFVGLAIFIAIKFIINKKLFSKHFFVTEFGVFLLPTVIGLYYSFFRAFEDGMSQVGSSIALEGYIYRDLYSSFIIILPATIYGLINAIFKKKIQLHHILLLIFTVVTVCMFFLGMRGTVSSYYYYKMYYILSLLCFATAAEGICDLCEKAFASVVSYSLVWIFMAVMNFTMLDDKITEKKVLMSPSSWHSGAFFSIHEFNKNAILSKNFAIEKMTLYEKAYDFSKDDKKITLLNTTEPIYWFEPFVQRDLTEFYCYSFDDCNIEDYITKIESCDYVVVPVNYDKRFDSMINEWKPVFENIEGVIYQVR